MRFSLLSSRFIAVVVSLCLLAVRTALAQRPGSLDPSFDAGAGLSGELNTDPQQVALQSDGKAVIVGVLSPWPGIVRLNPDGTVDRAFLSGKGTLHSGRCVVVQPDDKLVVTGSFSSEAGVTRSGIVRLQADGSLDTSFDVGSVLQPDARNYLSIRDLFLQADGKIVAAGLFNYTSGGATRSNLIRFHANGTLDTSFTPPEFGIYGYVRAIDVSPSGQMVLEYFTHDGTNASTSFVRLLSDGSVDSGFNVGSGTTNPPEVIEIAGDGSVLVAGVFTSFNGTPNEGFVRLTSSGAVDPNFVTHGLRHVYQHPDGSMRDVNPRIYTIEENGGKIYVGGEFERFGSATGPVRVGFARLNDDGSLDESFAFEELGAGVFHPASQTPHPTGIAVRPGTGAVLITGRFTKANGADVPSIAQLSPTGALDLAFRENTFAGFDNAPHQLVVQGDGKILVKGFFKHVNADFRPGLVRLNEDGSVDPAFTLGDGFVGTAGDGSQFSANLTTIALQDDGRTIVAGPFTSFNGVVRNAMARLNADGSLDPSFDVQEGFRYETARGSVYHVALWRDPADSAAPAKTVVGGPFTGFVRDAAFTPREGIARLNADGSLDTSFDPGTGFTHPEIRHVFAEAVAVQPDGRILASSNATAYNGTSVPRVVRLNSDGSLDTSFDATAASAGSIVRHIVLLTSGKILLTGRFPRAGSSSLAGIVRLEADGTRDASFDVTEDLLYPYGLAVQSDGKVLVVGDITNYSYGGVPRRGIVRLATDGSLDLGFDPGAGILGRYNNTHLNSIALQADGKAVIGGNFYRYDGTVRQYLARIHGGEDGGPVDKDLRIVGRASSLADPTGKTTRPGETLTYTLTYSNSGDAVTDVKITNPIPEGVKLASVENGGRLVTEKVGGKKVKSLVWEIGALRTSSPEATVSFSVVVSKKARIESEIDNLYEITGRRNGAPLPVSRGPTVHSVVVDLLSVTASTVATEVGPGGLFTYIFAVRNDGGVTMRDVELRYEVRTGSAVVGAFFSDASGTEIGSPVAAPKGALNPTVDPRGETVTWYFGKLPARTTMYAKITLRVWYDRAVDEPMPGGELFASFRDSKKTRNEVPRVVAPDVPPSGEPPTTRPFLGVSKTVDGVVKVVDPKEGEVAAALPGDTITFTLWYYNWIGAAPAERTFIQDRIPEGTAFVKKSLRIGDREPSGAEFSKPDHERTMTVQLGNLGPDTIGTVSYSVKVLKRKDGGLEAGQFVRWVGTKIESASLGSTPHSYPEEVLVKVVAPISFDKQIVAAVPQVEVPSAGARGVSAAAASNLAGINGVIPHIIRFKNNGGVPAPNARILNFIPAGTSFLRAVYLDANGVELGTTVNGRTISAPASGSEDGEIAFNLGALAGGEEIAVLLELKVTPAALELRPPTITNVARLVYGTQNTPVESLTEETKIFNPAIPRFFLTITAPGAAVEGGTFTYTVAYGNLSGVTSEAGIVINPPEGAVITGVRNYDGDYGDGEDGEVFITTNPIPGHTTGSFSVDCRVTGAPDTVVRCRRATIAGDIFSLIQTNDVVTHIYAADGNPAAAAAKVAGAQMAARGQNIELGLTNLAFKNDYRQINTRTLTTEIAGADFIPLKRGAVMFPVGGNQVLIIAAGTVASDGSTIIANDGASIISNDGASIISNDGASIISGGAGNIRMENLPGFSGPQTAASIFANPSQIISGGAGNILSVGGLNLFGLNGSALVNNAAGGLANGDYFRAQFSNIISGGAGNIISGGAGNIISGGAGNIVAGGAGNIISGGGGNLIGQDGAGIISNDGASLTTINAGNIISGGGGNIISGGAGN